MEYSQASPYEVGGRLAGQALRGQLTPHSVVDTILNPKALSLSERQTVGDMMGGDSQVMKMLGEIATNPFILLSLVMGPLGRTALREGRSFFNVRGRESVYKKSLGPLETLGISSPSELVTGTHLAAAGHQTHEVATGAMVHGAQALQEKRLALMKFLSDKHGMPVKSLNPDDFLSKEAKVQALRMDLQEIQGLHEARLKRLGTEVVDDARQAAVVASHIQRKVRFKDPKTGEWDEAWVDHAPVDLVSAEKLGITGHVAKQELVAGRLKQLQDEASARAEEATRQAKQVQLQIQMDLEGVRAAKGDPRLISKLEKELARAQKDVKMASIPDQFRARTASELDKSTGEKRSPLMDQKKIEHGYAQYGGLLDDLTETTNRINKEHYVLLLGDEAKMMPGGVLDPKMPFIFDDDKLDRAMSSMHTFKARGDDGSQIAGRTLLELVTGKDKADALWLDFKDGKIKEDAVRDRIKAVVAPEQWSGYWSPSMHVEAERVRGQRPGGGHAGFEDPDSHDFQGLERVIGRTRTEVLYNSDDLYQLNQVYKAKYGENLLTAAGFEHMDMVREKAQRMWDKGAKQEVLRTRKLSYKNDERYMVEMARSRALHSTVPSDHVFNQEKAYAKYIDEELKGTISKIGVAGHEVPIGTPMADMPPEIRKKISLYAMMERGLNGMSDPGRRQLVRDVFLPATLGTITSEQAAHMAGMLQARNVLRAAATGPFGRLVEKMGGKNLIDHLKTITDPDISPTYRGSVSAGVSKWLYATHMGLNLGSMAINLMQPLVLASVGADWRDVAYAYGKAAGEMGTYISKRLKNPKLFIDAMEQEKLIGESFKWAKNSGITPDWTKLLDAEAARFHGSGTGGKWDRALSLTMKGFEKTEWFNRSVTAHLMERMYKRAGRDPLTDPHFQADQERYVQLTQYGAHPLETPMVFAKRESLSSKMAGKLSNPLTRMFMSFPVRTLSAGLRTMPKLGEEKYQVGLAKVLVRSMGLSALTYELGKGLLGVDLSRGLAASAFTDVLGGERFLQGGDVVPLPPVLRIPLDFVRGTAGGDWGMVTDAFARAAVPGGVAFMRALNVMPRLPDVVGGLPQRLQKTYADYGNPDPATGTVPLYKGDGTLIEYRRPSEIVARALGVDLGTWGQQGELDGYLIQQRAEIVRYRQQFLMKLAANDVAGALNVRKAFGTKFKDPKTGVPLPLTVTREQIDSYLKNRVMGRTERILQGLPPELRGQYASAAESVGAARNVDLTSGASASQRRQETGWGIQDAEAQMLQAQDAVGPAAATPGRQPF